ncbi:MAG: DUF4381 domain-containing protein [Candidatus Polarisedimenticolaceae bacterium]|nr:DUF4381 domain-containing protein [Candidatus Polarisedimenticolaceae bacterium]
MNPIQPPAPALQLKDIHTPGLPELWPPAPGWWLVAMVALALLIWASFALRRHLQLRRQRAEVLALLTQLEEAFDPSQAAHHLAELSILLRRVALTRFPRQRVAALTGSAWLKFLDETGGNGQFSNGPGAILATGPYQSDIEADITPLLPLLRSWLKRNAGGPL